MQQIEINYKTNYKPIPKRLGMKAFTLALLLHFGLLAFYGFGFGGFDNGVIVSKLKIRLGDSTSIPEKSFISMNMDDEDLQYELADDASSPQTATAEKPQGKNNKTAKNLTNSEPAAGKQPEKTVRVEPPARGQRPGSAYGNANNGLVKAENYLQLLGYFVQEGAIVHTPTSLKGKAVLNLHINREGYVTEYELKKSSGYKALDNAAINFARRAMQSPLPPAPQNFESDAKILKYDFTIYYD